MSRIHPTAPRLLFAVALLLPQVLLAQAGSIRGRVADSTGRALTNATVLVDGTVHRARTGTQGEYYIVGVSPGTYTVRATALGFRAASAPVTVSAGGSAARDFALARAAIQLAPVNVVLGSRAPHSAAEELAVPVDVYAADAIQQQGTAETSGILQSLAPSVNFPRQSVTDANDIVRPFTLRGLSPDHTLVLLNGWRRHQTALVNNFAYGMGAGSSGVDLNALPASALERIEVLRDGAAAQYGSDAIAGVVNLVLKDGRFAPFLNTDVGQYRTKDYPADGRTASVSGGWGIGAGRGSLALFGQVLDRQPTNRAAPDPFDPAVPQPNHHWGDGLERNLMTFANFRLPVNAAGTAELYSFGGYSLRTGTGNGYRRYTDSPRNWPQIYPQGFLPEFHPDVTDYSAAGGVRGETRTGWTYDIGGSLGHNRFSYDLRNTLNASLGPCVAPAAPCAPGPDGVMGTGDEVANQTAFFAGALARGEMIGALNVAKTLRAGATPVNFAAGAAMRRETYTITPGEYASYVNGRHVDQFGTDAAPAGSQVFPGFTPRDATDASRTNVGVFAELETNLTAKLLGAVASRFESYSDFGNQLTGKVALRYQPSRRVTFRGAASTGFRAPGLTQSHFSKVTTNVIGGDFIDIGIFPVDHEAARLLGAKPLEPEQSLNFSGGVALSPTDHLTLTVDYFRITITDRILLGATFDDATTVDILTDAGYTTIGGVQYFTNGLDTRTHGIDVSTTLRVPQVTRGTLGITADLNWARNAITSIDPLPAALAGSSEPGLIDSVTYIAITEERPDWRGTLTGNYRVSRWRALARASYYGRFSSAQPGYCDVCRETFGAKTLVDAELGYTLNRAVVSFGIRNLFDTYPDSPSSMRVVDPGTGDTVRDYNSNWGVFPWAAASPFGYNGRYLYMRAEMQLGR